MKAIQNALRRFIAEDSGQDLIEYALIASLVGLGAVSSMNSLSTAISGAFSSISSSLTTSL